MSKIVSYSESEIAILEKIGYFAVFCFGICFQLFFTALSADQCHGPGAAYPGGCPQYSQAVDILLLVFLVIEALFLTVIVFVRFRLGCLARIFIFVLSSIFAILGPLCLIVLLDPLKLR